MSTAAAHGARAVEVSMTSVKTSIIACAIGLCMGSHDLTAAEDIDTSALDLFQAGFMVDETDDDFARDEWFFTYRNHRRASAWPWQESDAQSLDWGLDVRYDNGELGDTRFEGRRIAGMLGKRFSSAVHAELWLGIHRLETDDAEDDVTIYAAALQMTPGDTLDIRLETSRDFLYRDVFVPAGIDDLLAGRTHRLTATWRALPRVRAVADVAFRSLDDDNDGLHGAASLLYGISPAWPWIWLGIGAEWVSYDEQRPDYWSPDDFRSYGVRFQASFPIGPSFEASFAGNIDRIEENDAGHGEGQYFDAGLTYHLTPTLRLRLNSLRINSLQRGERWSQTTHFLSLAGPLR